MLLDESGLLMAPLVRRSWAPKGHPSVLEEKAGHREKVSVAGALCLTPRRDCLGLGYRTLANGYFDNEAVADFVREMAAALRGPAIVIWDGGSMHQGDPITDLVEESGGQLELERLPSHAPELMPLEQVWSWLKYSRLCNFAPCGAADLEEAVLRELAVAREDQELLRSFFHASDLPLPRTLLF